MSDRNVLYSSQLAEHPCAGPASLAYWCSKLNPVLHIDIYEISFSVRDIRLKLCVLIAMGSPNNIY